jgi:hypothetical protein
VKDYKCHINTGTARPIAVKGINYGPYETPIMRQCIAKLKQLGHISQISEGPWLFKALLAPISLIRSISRISLTLFGAFV